MPVKERQLLRAMGRIIRAVEIEHEIGGMLVGTVGIRTEPVDADAGQAVNLGPLHRILQSRERGLRPERRAAIAGHDLEGGIVTQPVGIVDVLVPGRDLVEALPKQRGNIVSDIPRVAGVCNAADDVGAETELLIELSDEQQTRVRCERAPREVDDEFWLESKPKLAITLCSHRTSSVGRLSWPKTPRKYHDLRARDGVFTYSFVNYPG